MQIEVIVVLTLAALLGIVLVPAFIRSPKLLAGSISFATGTLLAIVLGHVIPHAASMGEQMGLTLVGGFVLMMLLNHYLFHSDPCCDHDPEHAEHQHEEKLSLCTIGAMTVCTVNDGFVLGHQMVTFSHPLLWAMVAHKLTAAFGLYTMVKVCVKSKSFAHTFLLGLFVILTPLVYSLVSEGIIPPSTWMDHTLALSAGMLLYVVGVIFVPRCNELGHERPRLVISMMLLGVLATLASAQFEHQSHEGHAGHEQHDSHGHEGHDH